MLVAGGALGWQKVADTAGDPEDGAWMHQLGVDATHPYRADNSGVTYLELRVSTIQRRAHLDGCIDDV